MPLIRVGHDFILSAPLLKLKAAHHRRRHSEIRAAMVAAGDLDNPLGAEQRVGAIVF